MARTCPWQWANVLWIVIRAAASSLWMKIDIVVIIIIIIIVVIINNNNCAVVIMIEETSCSVWATSFAIVGLSRILWLSSFLSLQWTAGQARQEANWLGTIAIVLMHHMLVHKMWAIKRCVVDCSRSSGCTCTSAHVILWKVGRNATDGRQKLSIIKGSLKTPSSVFWKISKKLWHCQLPDF